MTIGNVMAVASLAAIAGLALVAAIPFAGNAALYIGTMLGWVLSGTAFVGTFLALVLLMIPTVSWVIAISAFLLLVVEAIFAGPLWAIAHLSMDQHGLAGRTGRKGYVLLLALFLTPVLMLFGFLVGMILLRVTGTLINGGFYYAITSAQSLSTDSWLSPTWMFGVLAAMILMAFVYVVILERSFSLIAYFPGRVFRWFDEIGEHLSNSAAERAQFGILAGTAALPSGLKNIGSDAASVAERRSSSRIPSLRKPAALPVNLT